MISCKDGIKFLKSIKNSCETNDKSCVLQNKKIDQIIALLSCLCSGICQIRNGKLIDKRDKKDKKEGCEGGVCPPPPGH